MNIQHSSRTDKWYTPLNIIELVHKTLGVIDLDPASDSFGNSAVQAKHYYTEEDNGLLQDWGTNKAIFLNPPGGKIGNQSKTALFWKKLMQHRDQGRLQHAIFLAFSLEALQVTQNKGCMAIAQFPLCIPASRIKFVYPDGTPSLLPSHSNVICYIPGTLDFTNTFAENFKSLGCVLNTKRHP